MNRFLAAGSCVVSATALVLTVGSPAFAAESRPGTEVVPAAIARPADSGPETCTEKIAKGFGIGAVGGFIGTVEAGGIGAAPGGIAGAIAGAANC